MFKKIAALTTVFFVLFTGSVCCSELNLSCKSAVLISADTGDILYELNKDEAMPPASITKIMTLLIIMEEIDSGNISYDDIVTASERAKSMGGSTIFLDAGERMTVHDLVKGICVASANDACVAMAEFIEGSCEAFVQRMNKRAEELGMTNTHFVNTNGLDADGHVSSAYDIAKMSRELLKHKDILNFTTIWTDSLRDGKFDLANTNKLIRFYEGANGLKTGSTSKAGCCISASASRQGMELIAVVMNAPDSKSRFADARTLLDYGFAKYSVFSYSDTETPVGAAPVKKGTAEKVSAVLSKPLYSIIDKGSENKVEMDIKINENLCAPIAKGEIIGKIKCTVDGKVIAECDLAAKDEVKKISFVQMYIKCLKELFNM